MSKSPTPIPSQKSPCYMPGSNKALTECQPKALKISNQIAMCFRTQSKLTRHGTARHGTPTLSGKNIR